MRASEVLQKCLEPVLSDMHSLRRQTLMLTVDALIAGRRLVLMDMARSWPGATHVRAPLKRVDRLLGNHLLHAARDNFYAATARWLIRDKHPLIIVDWCRLKADGRWDVLRASVPVGGRSMTLLDWVCPEADLASPQVERAFLVHLKNILPENIQPIVVTDAGFRAPWCRSVEALGWQWVTRLRNRTLVRQVSADKPASEWVASKSLYALAGNKPLDLGLCEVSLKLSSRMGLM